ncbi:MAG: hypothetical protein ACRD2N_00675 [Vicinamibacterales bacterium]
MTGRLALKSAATIEDTRSAGAVSYWWLNVARAWLFRRMTQTRIAGFLLGARRITI